jgi:hypothetical protein
MLMQCYVIAYNPFIAVEMEKKKNSSSWYPCRMLTTDRSGNRVPTVHYFGLISNDVLKTLSPNKNALDNHWS